MAVGLKKRRRVQLIVLGFACMAAAFGVIYFAAGDAIQYFRSPTQVSENPPASGEVFRLGGLVVEGSLRESGTTISFEVTDGNAVIPATFTGVRPDLFEEGQGMVGTGKLVAGIFVADEILAKHDETYMPREVIDALKEQGVYQETN